MRLTRNFLITVALLTGLAAQAACLPPVSPFAQKRVLVALSENPRGCWAGWWCPGAKAPYIAAAKKSVCNSVKGRQEFAKFVTSGGDINDLTFGSNPHTDPVLRAIWVPERAKVDALKP